MSMYVGHHNLNCYFVICFSHVRRFIFIFYGNNLLLFLYIFVSFHWFLGERAYETHYFNENVERVLIDDHNVPRLR